MIRLLLMMVAPPLAWLVGVPSQAPEGNAYSQSYSVFVRGELAGSEQVTETVDDDGNLVSKSHHELLVSDGNQTFKTAFDTVMTFKKDSLAPLAYQLRYSGGSGDHCEVTCRDGQIHRVLSRGGQVSEVEHPLGPDTVVFDFNVYHLYDYVIRRYDFKRKGRQVFQDFVPIVGGEIPLALTWVDDGELDYGRGKLPVRNFRIELVGVMMGNVSMDPHDRLVRVVIRDKDLEVLRADLVPEAAPPSPAKPPF
jgi:hypothetical protein